MNGTTELPLKKLLAAFGIRLTWDDAKVPSLGVKTTRDGTGGGSDLKLATVLDGSAAQTAGLAAGDVLVAINGLRVTQDTFEKMLARHAAGDPIRIHAFRRDELMRFDVRLDPPRAEKVVLKLDSGDHALRKGWLGA